MSARTALLVGSIVLLAACAGKKDERRAGPADSTNAAPGVVALSATEYALQAPDSIPAGWSTFRLTNRGEEIHYGHIVRLESGRTARDLVDTYAEAIRSSAPRPTWVTRFGGPGGTYPGDSATVTQYLEPGSYVWLCPVEDSGGTPHFAKGEYKPFAVHASAPGTQGRAAPVADVVIRLMDYTFALDAPLQAGRHTIRVENVGTEGHDLVLMKLAPGRTLEDVNRSLNPERARRADEAATPAPSPESLGTLAGGVATIGQGMESFFDAHLAPGEYALICMATAPDGRSHIEHGMIRQVSVR